MFPDSNRSQTIIDCFVGEVERLGVELVKAQPVVQISRDGEFYKVLPMGRYQYKITLNDGSVQTFNTSVGFNPEMPNGNYRPL